MRSPRVPWWPGSVVSDSGVHLHHLVFGIVTMMIAGTLGFAALGHSPYAEICAFVFGVGAGLTIDEFALWVYLDDVYWAEEGRSSIDATVIAAAAMGLVVLGINPFDIGSESEGVAAVVLSGLLRLRGGRDLLRQAPPPARDDRLLHLPDRALRRLADRQARLGLGAAALRRAQAEEAGQGRRALPARPPHRALQERLPRHRRRQAERGRRRGPRRGARRHPRGERRSPPPGRTRRPRGRLAAATRTEAPDQSAPRLDGCRAGALENPLDPLRQVPVPVAEQLHQRRARAARGRSSRRAGSPPRGRRRTPAGRRTSRR